VLLGLRDALCVAVCVFVGNALGGVPVGVGAERQGGRSLQALCKVGRAPYYVPA
jgi:hypothetical protein